MTPLVLSSLLLITAYTAVVSYKSGGIPSSISVTFYRLKHPYWFCAVMWLTAGLLMPAILEVSTPGTEWIAFLGCAGMLLVGVAPNFREEFEGKVHTAGAIITMLSSQVWVAFHAPLLLTAWALWLVYTMYSIFGYMDDAQEQRGFTADGDFMEGFYESKPLFWVEIVSLTTTYITIFFTL